jgi:hypothetical protein
MKRTQSAMIIDWLAAGRGLTPLQALRKFGCFRLAARVSDLRSNGHAIETRRVTKNGATYAEYRLQ